MGGCDAQQFAQGFASAVKPVNGHALLFHAPKPGLLAFGELMNGAVEFLNHVVAVQLALQMLGDEAVFKAVIFQGFIEHSLCVQGSHLLDQSFSEALLESLRDALAQQRTLPAHAEHQRFDSR